MGKGLHCQNFRDGGTCTGQKASMAFLYYWTQAPKCVGLSLIQVNTVRYCITTSPTCSHSFASTAATHNCVHDKREKDRAWLIQ